MFLLSTLIRLAILISWNLFCPKLPCSLLFYSILLLRSTLHCFAQFCSTSFHFIPNSALLCTALPCSALPCSALPSSRLFGPPNDNFSSDLISFFCFLYSVTKYIGGHSDVVMGSISCNQKVGAEEKSFNLSFQMLMPLLMMIRLMSFF